MKNVRREAAEIKLRRRKIRTEEKEKVVMTVWIEKSGICVKICDRLKYAVIWTNKIARRSFRGNAELQFFSSASIAASLGSC